MTMNQNEPEWIVNDLGELGVKLGDRFFFLYKGENLEYEDGLHEDGTPMLYRLVGKREFGEVCHPVDYYFNNHHLKDRYTEELTNCDDVQKYAWKPINAGG